MTTRQSIVFATGNSHKADEVREILADAPFNISTLKDMGWEEEIEEHGDSLEENALIKARAVYDKTGMSVFAEDTGLEVACLGGRPGVHTARYAGPRKDARENMLKLLEELGTKTDRKAQFRAVVALIMDGREYLFEGITRGHIAHTITGTDGFGYDPVFVPEGYDQSFAELGQLIKNRLSHRAKVMEKLRKALIKTDQA